MRLLNNEPTPEERVIICYACKSDVALTAGDLEPISNGIGIFYCPKCGRQNYVEVPTKSNQHNENN